MNQPSLLHLTPSAYRDMPWKNGLGSTTQLLIEPEGATLERGFDLRLSMAGVASSGPFSRFEGYDRTLLLLEGDGLRLDIEGRESLLLPGPLCPVAFRGDWTTSGVLLGGPCRDFNVITRRTRYRQQVEILRPERGPVASPAAALAFVFCARGRARTEGLELGPLELARLAGLDQPMAWTALEPGTALVVIALDEA